jgi:hypothetical protein
LDFIKTKVTVARGGRGLSSASQGNDLHRRPAASYRPHGSGPPRPDYIAFVCSSASELLANELVEEFRYELDHCKKEVVDIQNIKEIRAKTGLILDWMAEKGLETDEIAADITGGMTTMSVGVFSVTEERQVDSQYIRSQYDEQNRPVKNSQEAVFVSRYSKD